MSRRTDRVNDLLREEIGNLILHDLRDPRLAGAVVSVTEVVASRDLRHATVYVSSLGQETPEHTADALNRAAPYLQRELSRRLRSLRRLPHLRFESDPSLSRGAHLTEIIRDVSGTHSDDAEA